MKQLTTMKTHLIINIRWKCILMLLILTLGGWGKMWGQWSGVTYTSPQTITVPNTVTMTGMMTIDGCKVTLIPASGGSTITRDLGYGYTSLSIFDRASLFFVTNGGTLEILGTETNPIIIDGNNVNSNASGIDVSYGTLRLEYVTMKSHIKVNSSINGGGAFNLNNQSNYYSIGNFKHCFFHDNSSNTGGGGRIYASSLTMEDCEFYSNSATGTNTGGGGAIVIQSIKEGLTATLNCRSCMFYDNTSDYSGGGINNLYQSNIILENCQLYQNKSARTGGAISTSSGGSLSLTDCSITGNAIENSTSLTYSFGGGIYAFTSTVSGTTPVSLSLSGTVIIDGNSSDRSDMNNLYFTGNNNIVAISNLNCASSIGIGLNRVSLLTTDLLNVEFAQGSIADCQNAFANHCFFSDGVRVKVANSNPAEYVIKPFTIYYSDQSPYVTNKIYITNTGWSSCADASGCTIDGSGFVTHINSEAGMAYFGKMVNKGQDYTNKVVLLTKDLNLSGYEWEPIGFIPVGSGCSGIAFTGTFNGQGHAITGLSTTLLFDNVGLFGTVGSGGTVKNVIVASSTVSSSSAVNLGGIAGEVDGGSVYNCISAVTLSGGTNRGALVGKLTSGSVLNSFAISNDAACGSGTVTNCYVRKVSGGTASNMGTATNVGASGNTTGTFTETVTPYLYKHADNKVGTTALLTLLNAWVDAQSTPNDYARWTRTMASPINGDYPLLMLPGTKCVGTKSGNANVLNYGSSLNTMLGTHNALGDNIFLYASETGVSAGSGSANVYIAEDAALIHTSTITNAHVGVTLDNTNGDAGVHWHMFSPALSNAPLGINYTDNTDWSFSTGHPSGMPYYLFDQKSEANATYGYFPSHTYNTSYPSSNTSSYDYYSDWDFYCYYEPEYHWINFKRNGNAHHHEDLDHPHINYQATPSATVNQNETTLVPGKGYLVATAQPTLLEAKGTLNQGLVTMPVTKVAGWRTGYNLIGNPYQSYLDFDAFAAYNSGGHDNRTLWSANSVSNASYVILDKDGYSTHAYNSSANSFGASRYLHPHQGFMIVLEGSGSNAYFDNSMRTTTSTNAAFRDDEHIDYPLVNLIVTEADGNRDITTIELGRPDRGGALKQYDLRLGTGCLYTHYEDQDYAIAFTQPGIDHVGVRFETDEEATYTLTWDMENGEFSYLHLIDNITGSNIDCLQAREYRFTASPSDYKSRFKRVFEYTGIDEPEGDGPSTGSGTFAFVMGNELVVNVVNSGPSTPSTGSGTALLQMFDMTGRKVMEKTVCGTQTTVALPDLTAGMYVLRLNERNGNKVQKIIIK